MSIIRRSPYWLLLVCAALIWRLQECAISRIEHRGGSSNAAYHPSQLYRDLNMAAADGPTYTETEFKKAFERGWQTALIEARSSGSIRGSPQQQDSQLGSAVDCKINPAHRGKWQPGECMGARGAVWEEPGFHLYPFDEMFYPFDPNTTSFKSLVLITAGRTGMENVDKMVRQWGQEHFDYVLLHFDSSASEWHKFDWYARVVSITALRQAKMWYYKRFATPWLVKGYRYIHFIDSDAGSPAQHPFDLAEYDGFLQEHEILLGQPAVSLKGRSSDILSSRVHDGTLFRWTNFVENGPLYSVAQRVYACYWEMMNPAAVSGWGIDMVWCRYLSEVCGYSTERTCAVVDVHYIDHLNNKSASGQIYRGKSYNDYGRQEWDMYEDQLRQKLLGGGAISSQNRMKVSSATTDGDSDINSFVSGLN